MMRSMVLLGSVLLSVGCLSAQEVRQDSSVIFQCAAGFGIDGMACGSLNNYLNTVANSSSMHGMQPAMEWFVLPELCIGRSWSVGLSYRYLLFSKNIETSYGTAAVRNTIRIPAVMVHEIWSSDYFWLKAGGGLGYCCGTLKTDVPSVFTQSGSATGFSWLLDGVANLALDEHLFGYIGADIGGCLGSSYSMGEMQSYMAVPRLRLLTAGVKLGLMYQW